MRFHVLTLFPGAFREHLEYSMLALALKRGLVSIDVTDIRDYSHDPHRTADDYQFGGGHGMILKPEPVFEATEAALSSYNESERKAIPIILFTPQGEMLTQRVVEGLAQAPALAMICAHYAGIDNRVPKYLATREISLGDFVLTGGELPAMALIDAVSRLVPGVIGAPENVAETRWVRRSAGMPSRMASSSSRKPMSSMRSASSRTTCRIPSTASAPRLR